MTTVSYDALFIGGKRIPSTGSARFEVRSPYDGSLTGSVPAATTADIDRAVAAARAAFDKGPWPRLTPEERQAVLARVLELYEGRGQELADLVTRENGSPVEFTRLMPYAIKAQGQAYIDAAASYPWEQQLGDASTGATLWRREPLGVVAAIIPWNAPQQSAMVKLFPALLSGCTVVLKLAPETAIDGQFLGELFNEAGLPEGVLSIVAADREVSEHLVTHPDVNKIAFTGSTAAGQRIASLAGQQLKRYSLELGGKSACIILPGVDLPTVVNNLSVASFRNTGQACILQSRILVHRDHQKALVSNLSEMLAAKKIGDPLDPETAFGPVASERQRERVASYIQAGIDEGATVAHGGPGMPDGINHGAFVRPTIFTDVNNQMRIAREEIFGPVISVIAYSEVDEAIAIANDSDFGLSGGVWAPDVAEGVAIARQIRTGGVSVNGAWGHPGAPFGGYKNSGVGRECGAEGISAYIEHKSIAI